MDIEAIEYLVGFLAQAQTCREHLTELERLVRKRASFSEDENDLAAAIDQITIAVSHLDFAQKKIATALKLELGK